MIKDFLNKNKKTVTFILIVLIFCCGALFDYMRQDTLRYRSIMKSVIEKKLADKNPNPFFDGIAEPMMPSEEEIENDPLGPDKNKNGIRDDIDIWINRSFDDYNQRMAYRQRARASQAMIKGAYFLELIRADFLVKDVAKADACVEFVHDVLNISKDSPINILQFLTVHPSSRIKNSKEFSGSITMYDSGGSIGYEFRMCDFSINNEKKIIEIYLTKYNKNK